MPGFWLKVDNEQELCDARPNVLDRHCAVAARRATGTRGLGATKPSGRGQTVVGAGSEANSVVEWNVLQFDQTLFVGLKP
jgi:hypothetical protein